MARKKGPRLTSETVRTKRRLYLVRVLKCIVSACLRRDIIIIIEFEFAWSCSSIKSPSCQLSHAWSTINKQCVTSSPASKPCYFNTITYCWSSSRSDLLYIECLQPTFFTTCIYVCACGYKNDPKQWSLITAYMYRLYVGGVRILHVNYFFENVFVLV